MTRILNPHVIVAALGGDVTGRDTCNVPGPGHSKCDRSLSIKIVPGSANGFVLHSFANDDWKMCQEYILCKLGLSSEKQYDVARPNIVGRDNAMGRKKYALSIWAECIDP